MLILLPILTFVLLFLTLLGAQTRRRESFVGAAAAFLEAAAFLGATLLVFSELLSLAGLLTRTWTALAWALALAGVGGYGLIGGLIAEGLRSLRGRWRRPDWLGWMAASALVLILALLFLVAVISPPNNDDSLNYHMSRVAHWAQDASLRHYATAYLPQVMHPIGAELAILGARLLWGNDRLANLIQWSALAGILVGVAGMTGLLGAGKRARWVAAAFAASVPIGLLEATSTQNDLVTGFWFVSMLFFMVLSLRRKLSSIEIVCVGLTLGLGMLTKATFYFYVLPPLAFFCIRLLAKFRKAGTLAELLLVGALAASLNLGSWWRNLATFGSIFGQEDFVASHLTSSGPGAVVAGPVRALLLNFATPSDAFNAGMVDRAKALLLPIDPQMERFDLQWAWNNENLAGNPIHMVLVLAGFGLVLLARRLRPPNPAGIYALLLLGSFVALGTGVRYDLFGVRFQVPFFAASASLVGVAVDALGRKWLQPAMTLILLLAALPWVLFNRTRPLIAMRDSDDRYTIPCLAGCTAGSILNEPPVRTMFAGKVILQDAYVAAADDLRASGCRTVGLQLDSHDPEYLFWWLLDAPQSGMRLETIAPVPPLERYLDPAFRPCAILCTTCRDRARLHGLDLASDYSGTIQLYLGSGYDPHP